MLQARAGPVGAGQRSIARHAAAAGRAWTAPGRCRRRHVARPQRSATCSSSSSSSNSSSSSEEASPLAILQQCLAPGLLAAALAASSLAPLAHPPSAAAQAWAPLYQTADLAAAFAGGEEDASEALDNEALLGQEVEQPPELAAFLQLFEQGTPRDAKALEAARFRVGFRRDPSGRVSVRSGDDDWFAVKTDGRVPGFLLLRDQEGYCYYLPPDEAASLAQLDLSDDVIVASLFANGMWQELVEPLEAVSTAEKQPTQLRMEEGEWRGTLSLLDGAVVGEEQALPPLDEGGGEGEEAG